MRNRKTWSRDLYRWVFASNGGSSAYCRVESRESAGNGFPWLLTSLHVPWTSSVQCRKGFPGITFASLTRADQKSRRMTMTFNEGTWDRVIRILIGLALGYVAWIRWPGTAALLSRAELTNL